jgi:hypothetical protein
MTTADSCSLDYTQKICSVFATTYHGTCAANEASCQTCLDECTYSKLNTCKCTADTLTAAVACNATKKFLRQECRL